MNKLETREFLKKNLKDYVENITTISKGSNMYICPFCKSGTGKNHTGAFSIKNGVSWKCFSCNKGGDTFDMIGECEGISDYSEQFKRACKIYELKTDTNFASKVNKSQKRCKNEQYTDTCVNENFNDFFLEAHSHIRETDYPKCRGLSENVIKQFKLGYISDWKHPKAPNSTPSPRLIIPITEYSYIARDVREKISDEQERYKKIKVKGAEKVSWIFNKKALTESNKPIIVVEGEFDALSVIEVGGEAIAIGSTSNVKSFINLLKVERPKQPLIISIDNDEAGEKASKELEVGLNSLKIPFYRLKIAGGVKIIMRL